MKKRDQFLFLCLLVLSTLLNAQSDTTEGSENGAYNGKMGINTEDPTNTLHIVSKADPLRMEGLKETKKFKKMSLLLVTEEDKANDVQGGIVKKVPLKTGTVLDIKGGSDIKGNNLLDGKYVALLLRKGTDLSQDVYQDMIMLQEYMSSRSLAFIL